MPDEDGRLTLGERERVESCLSTHHKKCLHCQWEDMAEIQDRLVAVRPITTTSDGAGGRRVEWASGRLMPPVRDSNPPQRSLSRNSLVSN